MLLNSSITDVSDQLKQSLRKIKVNIYIAVAVFQVLVTWWVGRSGARSVGAQHREPLLLPRKQERGSQDVLLLCRRSGPQAREQSG